LRADRFLAFAEPLLTLHKHIPVREHLDDIAQKAIRRQRVPPPKHALSGLEFTAALEQCKFRRRLHFAEHLSDRKLLVQEQSFHLRRRDCDGACRDTCGLAVAYEVDFAALDYGFLGGSCVRAGRGVSVDGLDINAVGKEGTTKVTKDRLRI
jgi:hypothetical protein